MSNNTASPKEFFDTYVADPLVICKKSYISKVSTLGFYKGPAIDENDHKPIVEQYPMVNSCYSMTEDVDAFARVNHKLAFEAPSSSSISDADVEKFPYSERDAQIAYLKSTPLSFLVLGKPSIGQEELGRKLANYWNCVYIDSEILIRDEIEMGSRAGRCIEFNLRCGRAIGIDIILRLLQKRMRTESVAHRGFVLCGLPVIPNHLYAEDPITAETAIFTAQDIFEDVLNSVYELARPSEHLLSKISQDRFGDEMGEEEEEQLYEELPGETSDQEPLPKIETIYQEQEIPVDIGDSKVSIGAPPEIGTNFEEQLNIIFDLFDNPFMIVYVVCENADVIKKRSGYRFDVYSNRHIDTQGMKAKKMHHSAFPHEGIGNNISDEAFGKVSMVEVDQTWFDKLVKLPRHFPANVQCQLDTYANLARKEIEARILHHDQQYYIRVDGRSSSERMLSLIKFRLRTLPVQMVLLPEKLDVLDIDINAEYGEGDDADVSESDLPKSKFSDLQQCVKEFSKRQTASQDFKWELSEWGTKCPVAMYEGNYIDGVKQQAVHFMNKMFFLRDRDAFIKFHRNPRKYLLPPYPKCNGQIFVIGPPLSGRTAVAKMLGFLLDNEVFTIHGMMKKYIEGKQHEMQDRVKQTAINEAIDIINERRRREYQTRIKEQHEKKKAWLERFTQYLESEQRRQQETSLQFSSFPVMMGSNIRSGDQVEAQAEFKHIFLTEHIGADLLEHPEKMLRFLPEELTKSIAQFKPASSLDPHVQAIAEESVKEAKESELGDVIFNEDDEAEMFKVTLREVEERYRSRLGCRGGWIVDGMTRDVQILNKVMDAHPCDHVIILEDPSGGFLIEQLRYRGRTMFTDYKKLLVEMEHSEAVDRVVLDLDETDEKYFKDLLLDIMDDMPVTDDETEELETTQLPGKVPLFKPLSRSEQKKETIRYHQSIDAVKEFFISRGKSPIVIAVNDKPVIEIVREAANSIQNRYRNVAKIFSDEDRLEEARIFGNEVEREGTLAAEDYGIGDKRAMENFEKIRRYGDSNNFCPVTYRDKWVLWKGKPAYTAKFLGKIYTFSSAEDMDSFVTNPYKYLPIDRHLSPVPPPRICLVGNTGSGKTTLAKALARNYGLCYVSFSEFIDRRGGNVFSPFYEQVQDYLKKNAPLSDALLEELIETIWFQRPYTYKGFVIDDFPKRSSDVSFMLRKKTIPDMVLFLTVKHDELKRRVVGKWLSDWKNETETMRAKNTAAHQEIIENWEKERNKLFEQMIEQRKQERYSSKRHAKRQSEVETLYNKEDVKETDEDTDRSTFHSKSQVTFDSVAEQLDLDEVTLQVNEILPEPIFDHSNETLEAATKRFEADFNEINVTETKHLRSLKEMVTAAPFPFVQINGDDTIKNACYQAYLACDHIKSRNESLFERCYEISVEIAERLLMSGYYFLSKYGRTCPVQYEKGDIPMQMFLPMEQTFNLYPVIHRQFIYFLIGKEAVQEFVANPLKYALAKDVYFPLFPIRIAVIGPPKSGKSALAERFSNELYLKSISKGQATRHVISYLPESNLAITIEEILRKGESLENVYTIKSVEAACFDPRAITQGIVYDGFPNSVEDVRHMTNLGLVPHLILDLKSAYEDSYDEVRSNALKLFMKPYSTRFIEVRTKVWQATESAFRDWMHAEYQNVAPVFIDQCMWRNWDDACELVKAAIFEVRHYRVRSKRDWPLRLANMLVTPLEFIERQSVYKTYCPCCLHFFNRLTDGGFPPDRSGLIQFRHHFYYVCPEHADDFLEIPEDFLPPYNKHKMPDDLPLRVDLLEKPKNLHEDGFCVTCYSRKGEGNEGSIRRAVSFKELVYLFDSEECLREFMMKPMDFFSTSVTLKGHIKYPTLNYKDLPVLGTLEQYVAKDLIKALNAAVSTRPIIPGLTISQSILVAIGLHLKIQNTRLSTQYRAMFRDGLKLFDDRRKGLLKYLEMMSKKRNPYLYFEEPLPALQISKWIEQKFKRRVSKWSATDVKEFP